MNWGAEESRRRLDRCCFTAKKVSLLFETSSVHESSSFTLSFLYFWPCFELDSEESRRHHFAVRWFSLVDSVARLATQSSQPQVCFSVLSFLQCNKSSAIRKCRKWMRKLVLFGAFAFGTVIGRDWNCCCCKNYWLWFKPSTQMSPGLRNFLWPAFAMV